MEDGVKLLEYASKLIEEKEKKDLIEKVQDVWRRYRESLRPSSLTKADNEELHERARHLHLLLPPSSSSSRSPKKEEEQQRVQTDSMRRASSTPSVREERKDKEKEEEYQIEKEEEGETEEEEEKSKKKKKKKKEKDHDTVKKRRKNIKELETAVRTQGNLLKRFYDKAIEEIRDLQLKSGLHARALYHSIHKALWDHGALKPFRKRTGKNQQKATIEADEISPYLKPPPEASCLDRLEATEAFARAVECEDFMTACKLLRTKTRLLMFKTRPRLLAKFLDLYSLVHSKKKTKEEEEKEEIGEETTAASSSSFSPQKDLKSDDPLSDSLSNIQQEEEEEKEEKKKNDHAKERRRKRLTRKEKNARKRIFVRPPLGGPYSERDLNFFRKVWWTTLRKPKVLIKLLEPVAEWDKEEAKQMYLQQLAEFRERQREKNIQFWRERGVDLTKYTDDFTEAKGLDWIKDMQSQGALDQPPPSLIQPIKEEANEVEKEKTGEEDDVANQREEEKKGSEEEEEKVEKDA
ncbi:transmembrane protein [Cystoisospora suis]|uniref:Transmembrane protein n=1 Tax=Cystoisospora suis TaxID=483139 RepID=A0A2C6KK78_9APIC|nr:transmembrane protein [Cystoisospora suis]